MSAATTSARTGRRPRVTPAVSQSRGGIGNFPWTRATGKGDSGHAMRQATRMTVLLLAAGLAVLAAGCGGRPTGGGPTGDSAFASVENCAAFGHLEGQIGS